VAVGVWWVVTRSERNVDVVDNSEKKMESAEESARQAQKFTNEKSTGIKNIHSQLTLQRQSLVRLSAHMKHVHRQLSIFTFAYSQQVEQHVAHFQDS